MSRSKKMILLIICLAVLIGAYFGVTAWAEKSVADDNKTYTVTDVDPAEIVQLDWSYEGNEYVLSKIDGVWVDPYNEDFEVNQDAAEAMAAAVSSIEASVVIDDAVSTSDYGFYEDTEGIRFEMADGSAKTILTGSYNEVALDYYAMIQGGEEIYVVTGSYLDSFEVTMDELAAPEESETEE
ncbi:MAG: DUF4340 domain-containing protein [Firmicutes bacterium]|nr:DUF4340 domain-containing protein [Bacillota bacterium]